MLNVKFLKENIGMIFGSEDIAERLQRVHPVKVAVAYVGRGWSRFLDPKYLRSVVVSPNLGSNPSAIVELAETVGWENLRLLEGLHSKLYIGDDTMMIGSANLSSNAFGSTQQEEACVVISDQESMQKALELFDRYVSKAEEQFPDKQSKLKRIEKLRQDWRKAVAQGLTENELAEVQNFSCYRSDRDGRVYLAWYINEDSGYTNAVPVTIQNDIKLEVHLSPDDLKPRSQWILHWLMSHTGAVDGRSKPTWVYIHEVFDNGCDDEGYEMLCIQRSSLFLPPRPFDEEDPHFVESFRKVMNRDEFSRLRGESDAKWRLKDKVRLTKKFISALQEEYGRGLQKGEI